MDHASVLPGVNWRHVKQVPESISVFSIVENVHLASSFLTHRIANLQHSASIRLGTLKKATVTADNLVVRVAGHDTEALAGVDNRIVLKPWIRQHEIEIVLPQWRLQALIVISPHRRRELLVSKFHLGRGTLTDDRSLRFFRQRFLPQTPITERITVFFSLYAICLTVILLPLPKTLQYCIFCRSKNNEKLPRLQRRENHPRRKQSPPESIGTKSWPLLLSSYKHCKILPKTKNWRRIFKQEIFAVQRASWLHHRNTVARLYGSNFLTSSSKETKLPDERERMES